MKHVLPILMPVLLMVSCSRYQYLTVQSTSPAIQKNARSQFVAENDSLLVIYDFKGHNLPLGITITNKLDRPVMVDWKRCSVIINDKAFSMVQEEAVTTGAAISRTVGTASGAGKVTAMETVAVTSLPEGMQQVPPRSYIRKEPLKVTYGYLKIPRREYVKTSMRLWNGGQVRVREISFPEEASPLRFRTWLTLVYEGEERKTVGLDHSFFVSGIVRTGRYLKDDDRPFLEKSTALTGVVTGIAATVLVVGAAAAAFAESENNEKNK